MMRNSGGEGGEGGMPNMQDILNNPEMMEMARNMMGGGGGARQ
jgi:small glutamine-rich tetratricopeptide repeat-containing protein alpha